MPLGQSSSIVQARATRHQARVRPTFDGGNRRAGFRNRCRSGSVGTASPSTSRRRRPGWFQTCGRRRRRRTCRRLRTARAYPRCSRCADPFRPRSAHIFRPAARCTSSRTTCRLPCRRLAADTVDACAGRAVAVHRARQARPRSSRACRPNRRRRLPRRRRAVGPADVTAVSIAARAVGRRRRHRCHRCHVGRWSRPRRGRDGASCRRRSGRAPGTCVAGAGERRHHVQAPATGAGEGQRHQHEQAAAPVRRDKGRGAHQNLAPS